MSQLTQRAVPLIPSGPLGLATAHSHEIHSAIEGVGETGRRPETPYVHEARRFRAIHFGHPFDVMGHLHLKGARFGNVTGSSP